MPLLLLPLLMLGPRQASAQCVGSAYSYGSDACASCASGASFVSSSSGCTPSATLAAGPVDTAFFLSGSSAEGVAAFVAAGGAAPAFVADAFGNASGALALLSGVHLDAAGASAPAALPAGGNVAWSASAWVRCAAPSTYAGVLEWGAAGDAQGIASTQAAALVVAGPAAAAASWATGGIATTLAGSAQGFGNGTGVAASFFHPAGIAVMSPSGDIAVADADNNRIRLVTPLGVVSTLAGSGLRAFADGAGADASFWGPQGVAVLPASGDVVVSDFNNNRIRLVTPLGFVTTLAGSGIGAGLGKGAFADGEGTSASFFFPSGLAVIASSGVVVVADQNNHRIRLVTSLGGVTTLAGSGSADFADGAGANASFSAPAGVVVIASSGVIVVADAGNNRIRLVTPFGVVSTLAGSGSYAFADGAGTAASFKYPSGLAVIPSSGLIVVADTYNFRIRLVTPLGVVTTLAGVGSPAFADGTGAAARFAYPESAAVIASSGQILVGDWGNDRIRLVTSPQPSALAACDSTWHHVAQTYLPIDGKGSLLAFLDGAIVQQLNMTNFSLAAPAASTLRVGWSGDLATNGGSLFGGSLAQLRIYNRTLSTAEVVALSQPPLKAFANTKVEPATPTVGRANYSFACVPGCVGQGGVLEKTGEAGSWEWAGGVEPRCVEPPPAAVGSSGAAPLGPAAAAGIALAVALLLGLAAHVALTRLRLQWQVEQLTNKTTMASRARDRARLLQMMAERRASLKAEEEAAAVRDQLVNLPLRAKAHAVLEAATAARSAASARLAEAEALAALRNAEAGRRAKAAEREQECAATDVAQLAAGADAEAAFDRVRASLEALLAARAEERRTSAAEGMRVAAARAELAACERARDAAAATLAPAGRRAGAAP